MQLVYNRSYNRNIYPTSLEAFLEYYIKKDKCSSAVLVVPTRKYVNYIKKEWIKQYYTHHNKAITKLHIYNLIDFATLVLKEIKKHNNVCCYSDAALLSLMEEAMKILHNEGSLVYYNRISYNILEKIFDVVNGLRKDGITSKSMQDELVYQEGITSADKRFSDITKIYSLYEDLLAANSNDCHNEYLINSPDYSNKEMPSQARHDRKYYKTDEVGIFNAIIESQFNMNDLSFLDKDSMIYFYDFTEFKMPEAKFVSLFSECNVPVLVSIDYSKESGPMIDNLPQNVRRLVTNELNTNLELDNTYGIVNNIKTWLFNDNVKLFNPNLKKQISIYEAENQAEEVKNIVRLCVDLNKKQGIPFSDMCICSRQSDNYAELFREYFSESGVVVNISDRYDLASSDHIVQIFYLLELVVRRWRRTDLERLHNCKLLINYLNKESQVDNIKYNLITLISVANKYRIIGGYGKNRWLEKLTNIENITINEEYNDVLIAKNTLIKLHTLLDFKNTDKFSNYTDKVIEIIDILV
ncbi:MAG: hypothetical protein FWG85_00770 [Bacteroidetes bacterium]|nr:hypothetical protein [Bacteroidota bacterium]